MFKNLLLENYKCQSFDISYEASLGHGDSNLLKSLPLDHKWGHAQGSNFNIHLHRKHELKTLLLVNCKCQSFASSYEASLGYEDSSVFKS